MRSFRARTRHNYACRSTSLPAYRLKLGNSLPTASVLYKHPVEISQHPNDRDSNVAFALDTTLGDGLTLKVRDWLGNFTKTRSNTKTPASNLQPVSLSAYERKEHSTEIAAAATSHIWRLASSYQPSAKRRFSTVSGLHDSETRHEHETGTQMSAQQLHNAVVAFGSNLGDRLTNVENALSLMKKYGLKILSISHLYETIPMYYANQQNFLNGICSILTDQEPLALLDILQRIENDLGRRRLIDKGPRTMDLDVIMYDAEHIDHERLKVPHPLMLEREFVLRPLADVLPEATLPSTFVKSFGQNESAHVRAALERVQDGDNPMRAVTVLKSNMSFITSDDPHRTTQLMAILNITPDSFSDGGGFYGESGLTNVVNSVKEFIEAGATILDVGGQSTRPNADLLSPEEELERVIPVVRAIRKIPEADKVAISIDTFYASVAEKAVQEGADIINDVSAGLLDPQMLSTAARLGKTIILMHMRGNPHTMNSLCDYPEGVINGVAKELADRVAEATAAGIPPWRIILDPGIGFAKNQEQNLQLLRYGRALRDHPSFRGIPWLVGTSRKGFVGKITGVKNAAERQWGTAVGITAAIAEGADIVRVHDVPEMAQVRTMADAIYRTS